MVTSAAVQIRVDMVVCDPTYAEQQKQIGRIPKKDLEAADDGPTRKVTAIYRICTQSFWKIKNIVQSMSSW